MKSNPFYNFSLALFEAEDQESDLEKILRKSPKVANVLMALLTSQKSLNDTAQQEIRKIVSDIKVISFRPTTFRIIFQNSNYFDLVYDPTPIELKHPENYRPVDYFRVAIAGKRYDLSNDSSFEQALDYIGQALKYNPIDSNNPDTQEASGEDGSPELPSETDKPKA